MSETKKTAAIISEVATDEDSLLNAVAADLTTYDAIEDDEEDASWLRDQRIQHKTLHWFYRPSFAMVGSVLFLIAFATASAMASGQMIQYKLACNSLREVSKSDYCDPAETQVLISSFQQAASVARGIATIVASGKVSPLSDKYGRKFFIIAVISSSILSAIARFVVTSSYSTLQFGPLVAIEFFGNCTGGYMSLVTLANCYVSDIADASKRTYYFGLNIACLFVGMSTGPLVGNLIVDFFKKHAPSSPNLSAPEVMYGPGLTSSDFAPLKFEIFLAFCVLLFVVFVLPESRGENARRMSRTLSEAPSFSSLQRPQKPTKLGTFLESINFVRPMRLIFYPKDSVHRSRHKNITRTRIAVVLMIATDCVISSLAAGLGEIIILYGLYQFKWTTVDIGRVMAITSSARAFVLIFVTPLLTHRFFEKFVGFVPNKRKMDFIDYGMIMIGFLCEACGQFFMSGVRSSSIFIVCLVVNSIACISFPALQSSVVKFYPESKIGELFGGVGIAKNICNIVAPVAMLALYKTAVSKWDFPQILFMLVGSAFTVSALVMTFVIVTLSRDDGDSEAEEI